MWWWLGADSQSSALFSYRNIDLEETSMKLEMHRWNTNKHITERHYQASGKPKRFRACSLLNCHRYANALLSLFINSCGFKIYYDFQYSAIVPNFLIVFVIRVFALLVQDSPHVQIHRLPYPNSTTTTCNVRSLSNLNNHTSTSFYWCIYIMSAGDQQACESYFSSVRFWVLFIT